MMTKLRLGTLGAVMLGLSGLIVATSWGQAGADDPVGKSVRKIAAALKDGDKDAAAKEAAALVKKLENLEEAMHSFKPRKKGGLGVGPKGSGANPDGIELMINKISRDVPTAAQMNREAEWLEQMAYDTAAMAEIAKLYGPKKDKGQASKKNWNTWTNEMQEGALALAKAAAQKGGQQVKTAATKANNSCNSCHMAFRGKVEVFPLK